MDSSDLHCHLYGCLDEGSLIEAGKNRERHKNRFQRVYADYFEKIWAIRPTFEDLFSNNPNISSLTKFYSIQEFHTFPQFQAKINLPIALFPFEIGDYEIYERALSLQAQSGVTYGEYRSFFPFHWVDLGRKSDCVEYLLEVCKLVKRCEDHSGATFRMIASLPRTSPYRSYEILKELQKSYPLIREYFVGIDFCENEENDPPGGKKPFIQKVIQDNRNEPKSGLTILYHVGETFSNKTIETAVRWVDEVAEMGAHRLGHAIALGIDPMIFKDQTRTEDLNSFRETLGWIKNQPPQVVAPFIEYLDYLTSIVKKREEEGEDSISIVYQESHVDLVSKLQDIVMEKLKNRHTVIESCPTSNLRLSPIFNQGLSKHPVHRFWEKGLNFTISSDDPGMFGTNVTKEIQVVSGGNPDFEQHIARTSDKYKSTAFRERGNYDLTS